MNNFVVSLSHPSARDAALTGSKGAALARITKAGLSIPPGFVVTTALFQAVTTKLGEGLSILDGSGSTSENALKDASAPVQRLIIDAPLPGGAAALIRSAWKAIGNPAVSVRSSSTAEDLADASFAGQYDSYLNVTSAKDLLEKVKLVWASLHSAHAIGYRRRHSMSHQEAHMAVVVQRQLSPEASGVLFTRDPVTGKNQMVISAALGLGEGVVAGTAQTDRFVLRPIAGTLITCDIVAKKARIANAPGGGIEAVAVDASDQQKAALNKPQLAKLAHVGRKLVKLFGGPQDVEFATLEGKVQILQSRPMTAIEPAAKADEPWNRGLDRSFSWNRRGGPYFRLEQDAAVARLKHMKDCYDETGSSMTAHHIGHVANGYLYVRSNEVGERTLKKRHKLQTQRVDASMKKGKSYFEDVLQAIVEERLDKLRLQRAGAKTFAAQVDYMKACIETMGYVQGNLHWRQGKPGGRGNWHKEFSEITGEAKPQANLYVQAIQNRMTRVISQIRDLAKIVQSDSILKRIFIERDFETLGLLEVSRRPKVKQFHIRFKAMMRVYGIRAGHGYGTGSGFATPTWNMDHTIPFEYIAAYVEQNLAALDQQEKQARAERVNATQRMRRRLAHDADKLKRFNQALTEATIGVRFLEDHNYYMEQCTIGTMRQSIHAVGQALVDRGQLDAPDDVFHFSVKELERIGQKKKHEDLRPCVTERSEELERRRRMNAPASLGKKPKRSDNRDEAEQAAGLDGDVIRGASASSGQATGKAVVVRADRQRPRIRPGDILVASNVGPDWTPVFAIIGGLVLDSGSLSQHAALVAREYRIPAVMQTKEASKIIRDGQQITVDGDAGMVKLGAAIP